MFRYIIFLVTLSFYWFTEATSTLELVHVIFRHGDRTPDKISLYPNDPHLNDSYFPYGFGALTMQGQMQEYRLGNALRRRYNNYLGKIYTPSVLDAWSTDTNRTKMSLQLVLAGLWPPPPSQIWNILLPWLPIPYNYIPSMLDELLSLPLIYCEQYQEEMENVSKLDKFKSFLSKNDQLIQHINHNSGLNVTSINELFNLYFGLYAEEQNGRVLPKWTNLVYPDFLEKAVLISYLMQTYTDTMKQALGGKMVKRVIDDAKAKIKGYLKPKERKIFLFSGHEYNIAHILSSLGIFEPHIPPYASYILFELHKINYEYGFKIYYQNYTERKPRLMTIPECAPFCPLKKFIKLTEHIIDSDDEICSI